MLGSFGTAHPPFGKLWPEVLFRKKYVKKGRMLGSFGTAHPPFGKLWPEVE